MRCLRQIPNLIQILSLILNPSLILNLNSSLIRTDLDCCLSPRILRAKCK